MLVGCLLLTLLDVDTSRALASAYLVVIGVGMGCMFQTFVIATQNRVDPADLGVATAAIQFFRSMGGSLAVAILGALLIARLPADIDPNRLTSGAAQVPDAAREALNDATHAVFVACVPLAAVIFVLAFWRGCCREHPSRELTGERLELARDHARDLVAQVAHFGIVRELQGPLAGLEAVSDTRSVRARACA